MKHFTTKAERHVLVVVLVLIAVCALAVLPRLSHARSEAGTIVVTNSSTRSMRFIYLSPVNRDDWTDDLLNNGQLAPGQSVTIGTGECTEPDIKVIAEDSDGCFVSSVVSCGSDEEWTITGDSVRDCGN